MKLPNKESIKPNQLLQEIKQEYKEKLEKLENNYNNSNSDNIKLYKEIKNLIAYYKSYYDIDLNEYKEFVSNKFDNEQNLLKKAEYIYRNTADEVTIKDMLKLIKYCKTLATINEYNSKKDTYTKLANLTTGEFRDITKKYYYAVQKQMIVNGYAYKFQGHIGAICINRCKNRIGTPVVDPKATKLNKEKLIKEGKEIYDAEKEAYYKLHNLEYKGVDPRVWIVNDYIYEFCLLWSGLRSGHYYKFEPVDSWSMSLRGKTKDDFKREANGNLDYICNLDITFRTKVTLCTEIDETLFIKLIRNEHQIPITTHASCRKSG